MKRLLLSIIALIVGVSFAYAETPVSVTMTTNGTNVIPISPTFPFPVMIMSGNAITISGSSLTVTGTSSNAASAISSNSLNVQTLSYNYGFNGTTWDQLQVDASKNLKIVGNVGGYNFQISPTVTISTAAYVAGNSMGGLITATGAARTNGGSGILAGMRIKSTSGATNTLWVYAWSKTPVSTCTDRATFVSNTTDQSYALVGFPMQTTLGNAPGTWDTATYANLTNLVNNFKNQDTSPSTNLYLCIVTTSALTPASISDLSMVLGGVQD